MIKNSVFELTNFDFNGNIKETDFNGVYVSYNGKDAVIGYATKVQQARCYFLLSMKIQNGETEFEIKETPVFETCGPMLDLSSGAIMKVAALKKYFDCVAALGLNMVMLYTEDIYEMPEYPMFGYMRGRYTKAELKEIDGYAYELGIEIIPCIQTLGHLQQYMKWAEAAPIKGGPSTLLPDEEKTYEFIECEIKTVRECFRSNRIHIGMDEAGAINMGRHYQIHGFEPNLEIFNRHLKRVKAITEKYGYSNTIIWPDMYFTDNDSEYYYEPDGVIPQYAIDSAPGGVELMFWDYYHTNYDYYHKKFVQYERFADNPVAFAGGVWAWDSFASNFRYDYDSMRPALEASIDHGIKTVLATIWGGKYVDFFKVLGGLCVFSEMCYKGKACTEDDVYAAATHITGQQREFIDAASEFYLGYEGSVRIGHAFFFSDILLNRVNYDTDYDEALKRYKKALKIIDKHPDNKYHKYYALLFEIVCKKVDILNNIKKEYKAKNRAYFSKLSSETLPALQKLYREFALVFQNNWCEIYRPFGLEKILSYFGGIDYKLSYDIETINKYLDGSALQIDELEVEIATGLNLTWRDPEHYMFTMS